MGIYSDVLLTVDYDRTLTDNDSNIPQRNLEAIRYFIENGGAFTVNTGRSVPMSRLFMDKVPINAPLLLYNGSAAYDTVSETFTFCHEIQMDMWKTIAECLELFPDLTVEIQGVDAHYRFIENPAWDAFCEHQPVAHAFARPSDDIGPFLKFSVYGKITDVTVSHLYDGTPEELARIDEAAQILKEKYGEYCEVFRSATRILDIHARGVSKARSARQLQQQMGRKILVCVGDAQNDLSMLRDADYAFVPSDAVIAEEFPNVCQCGDGAVADVIYEKIPEILKKKS